MYIYIYSKFFAYLSSDAYRKWSLVGQTVTFPIVGGQWCDREPRAHNKLRGSVKF